MKKFKELRQAVGATQSQIAEKLNVAQSTVATWEINENSYPRAEILPILAYLLHCSIDELFGRGKEGSQ